MVSIKLYVEGAGERASEKSRLREAVRSLLVNAGLSGRLPAVVACGGRQQTYDKFSDSQGQWLKYKEEKPFLFVDSEDPVSGNDTSVDSSIAWDHLKSRDNWNRPADAQNHQALLMATCMETWIVADQDEVVKVFGKGFNTTKLPTADLETRNRHDLEDCLTTATKDCKGPYKKGNRSFEALAVIRPSIIRSKLPHAERFFKVLEEKL